MCAEAAINEKKELSSALESYLEERKGQGPEEEESGLPVIHGGILASLIESWQHQAHCQCRARPAGPSPS